MAISIHFTELELIDILNYERLHLNLNAAKPVTVLQGPQNYVTPVAIAIEMLCTRKYATADSLKNLQKAFGNAASIRIHFLTDADLSGAVASETLTSAQTEDESADDDVPCTSHQAVEREALRQEQRRQNASRQRPSAPYHVMAERFLYNDPLEIVYTVNDGISHVVSVDTFYERFFQSLVYMLPQLKRLHALSGGNWLAMLNVNGDDREEDDNPFRTFANLFLNKTYTSDDFLGRLTSKCLEAKDLNAHVIRFCLLKLFKQVHTIFDFITCFEYTVWFYVPQLCVYKDVHDMTLDDLDFTNIKTRIQLVGSGGEPSNEYFVLSEADHTVKDMLLIAFQLSLAFSCEQKVVILQDLNLLRDYQTLKFASAAFMEKSNENTSIKWPYHNYLQRIIDVCYTLKLTAFIEYPGGIPLQPKHVNLVKFNYQEDIGKWIISLCDEEANNEDPDEFLNYLDSLK